MGGVNEKDFTKVTVSNSATTLVRPAGARGCLIEVQSNGVSYRMDGTAPVAAAGSSQTLNVGDRLNFDSWSYPGNNWASVLDKIQFIRTTGSDGILSIEWFD